MARDPYLGPAPGRLEGPRVVVRPLTDEDASPFYDAIQESIEHIRPWLPWYRMHQTVEDTRRYVRFAQSEYVLRAAFHLGMFDTAGHVLGGAGLSVRSWEVPAFEIGYWVRASAEGHGYVTEAARLLTESAFDDLGAERVTIRCHSRNGRSAAVAERLGYTFEGTLRNLEVDAEGRPADMRYYSLIPAEYQRARQQW